MKNFTPITLSILTFCLLVSSASLFAQSEIIVTQKVNRADGSVMTVKKKMKTGEDWETYVKELEDQGEAQQLDMQIEVVEQGEGAEEANTLFRFRRANRGSDRSAAEEDEWREKRVHKVEKWKEYAEKWEKRSNDWEHRDYSGHNNDNRAFLGVYSGTPEGAEGVLLEGIVQGSGAQAAGLQKGDILTSMNGERMVRGSDLTPQLAKYEPGNTVSVTYLRDGKDYQTQVVLGKKREAGYSWTRERDPCKVFIGVYTSGYHDEGQRGREITSIIKGTSAEAAALQAGDVILAIDGVSVTTHEETITERDKHEPGDYYNITYLRNGVQSEVKARFKPCGEEETTLEEELVEEVIVEEVETPSTQPESDLSLFSWSAFPNPTVGKINVRFEAEAVPTTLQVVDASGKVVYREVINNFDGYYNKELNLGGATPGALFIQVRQGEQVSVEKIMLLNRA